MKKRQWMAWLLGGCLLLGLAACKQNDTTAQEEENSTSYAEDIQKKKDAAAAEQEQQAKQDEASDKQEDSMQKDESADKQDAAASENGQDDASQDGEARNQISKSEAKASVVAEFGSEDADGQAYEYNLESIEQIGSHKYYVYRMSWAEDDQDGGAYSKTLKYIFVATDGSTIHTGTADDDGYDIDYSS